MLSGFHSLKQGKKASDKGFKMQAEALHRQFKAKKEVMERQSKSSIMDTYGNAAKQPDGDEARLLLGQTEGYVEYNAAGRVIKGEEIKVSHQLLSCFSLPRGALDFTAITGTPLSCICSFINCFHDPPEPSLE